jgi:hypothetical protein
VACADSGYSLPIQPRSRVGFVGPSGRPLMGRHPDRLQLLMCTARARFHPIEIRAHIVPRQIQHPAPELPIFLDLRLGLRRSPCELAMRIARRCDPPHRRFESGRVRPRRRGGAAARQQRLSAPLPERRSVSSLVLAVACLELGHIRRRFAKPSQPGPRFQRSFVCPRNGSFLTRRWSKPDSNSRSHPLTRSRSLGGAPGREAGPSG